MFFVEHAQAALELHARDLFIFNNDLFRPVAGVDFDVFVFRFLDFLVRSGHDVARLEAEQVDAVRADADRRTRNVDGDVAAADHDGFTAEIDGFAGVDSAKEFDAGHRVRRVFAFDSGFAAALRADCDIERVVSLPAQFVERNVFADVYAGLERYAHLPEHVDLRVDDVFFKAERRDAERQHATKPLLFFKHGDRVAVQRKVIRAA